MVGFLLGDDDDEDDDNDAASDSKSSSEEALELLFEEARSTAGNSSLDGDGDGEGLLYCRCFRDFLDGRPGVRFALFSRLRFLDERTAMDRG